MSLTDRTLAAIARGYLAERLERADFTATNPRAQCGQLATYPKTDPKTGLRPNYVRFADFSGVGSRQLPETGWSDNGVVVPEDILQNHGLETRFVLAGMELIVELRTEITVSHSVAKIPPRLVELVP